MKKFIFLLCCFAFAALYAADDYSFVALGDIHFDGEAYHTSEPKHAYQKRERERNIGMWKSGKSAEVLTAAQKKVTQDMPFVVQLGDFTQGDCDTQELQEKMFIDGFATVKKFFPDTKFLPVKGNHDVRVLNFKGNCNAPAKKALFPLIAKELGRDKVSGNYVVRQGKDLFIFFDGFIGAKKAVDFVRKTLDENKDVRYTFFLTHLPVLPCMTKYPAWTIPNRAEITGMLAERNAIILTAHTHQPSFITIETDKGKLTQMVVTSMGNQWNPKGRPAISFKNFKEYLKKIPEKTMKEKGTQSIISYMKNSKIDTFEIYTGVSGFAVITVNDSEVRADIYANESGKPWKSRIMRKNR